MEDITTQVLGVRQEPSKDGQSIKHIVSLAGGTGPSGSIYPAGDYVTFNPDLSGRAAGLVNQPVSARVEIKQVPKAQGGGFWINNNIEDIAPAGGLTPPGDARSGWRSGPACPDAAGGQLRPVPSRTRTRRLSVTSSGARKRTGAPRCTRPRSTSTACSTQG